MLLSIVSGTLNRVQYLKPMIESVRERVQGLDYEIIIVDSFSEDGTQEYLRNQPDVLTLEQKRLGAVRAFNFGFSVAQGTYVCNLNDDVICHGDLFNEAIAQMRDPQIGQVAFPFGKEELLKTCAYMHPGKTRNLLLYGNFAMTRRVTGTLLGWWGKYYKQYAGDAELSMRIHQVGLSVVELVGKGWIEHLELQDSTRVENKDSAKFYERWKDWE